jgi:hypothetical protein
MKRIENMSLWERVCFTEIVRGLSVTGCHFWRNLSMHILHAFGNEPARIRLTTPHDESRVSADTKERPPKES